MGLIVLIVMAVVAGLPFLREARRKPVGEAERRGAPGGFAHLSQGVTHYQWIGPARGPVAVAIHGTSISSLIWADIAEGLGKVGYRVLVYDLYGRGLSDAPKGAQDRAFFLRQLTDLLADQKLGQDLTLIGYALGGAIATAFTSDHPERVKRMILLAPMGMGHTEGRFERFIRTTPVIGDWFFFRMFGPQLRAGLAAAPNRFGPAQLQELDHQGFMPAVLSTARGMDQENQESDHRAIGRADVPVIAIWAQLDPAVPLSGLGTLSQWNRNARQEVIEGAARGLPFTHATEVLKMLKDVLRET